MTSISANWLKPAAIKFDFVTQTTLHLVGSTTTELLDELSLLYARDCLAVTNSLHEAVIVHVDPDGSWRLVRSLDADELDAAPALTAAQMMGVVEEMTIDAVVPQMFCVPGMTTYRSIWEVLGIPVVGNRGAVMALAANKAWTRAVLGAADIAVPAGQIAERSDSPTCTLPVVVKPVDADNSAGVSLVRNEAELAPALEEAWRWSQRALIETLIPAGREVRCGILDLGGSLQCLPIEEYALNPDEPVRKANAKLGRKGDGSLQLMAKNTDVAWMVDPDDPLNTVVSAVAKACHRALGCRDHSLWDIRVDPEGRPWVLEASLYCSFARQSVISMMSAAAGIELEELFARSVAEAVKRGPR